MVITGESAKKVVKQVDRNQRFIFFNETNLEVRLKAGFFFSKCFHIVTIYYFLVLL